MISEYFSFYNEFDMLELKLQEHSPHVDRFVVTESNRTYNQIEKPYRLRQQWDRYAQWHDKITYLQMDAGGLEPGWHTEEAQREYGIHNCPPESEDIVLISDLDEFLTPAGFRMIHQHIDSGKREILFLMNCYWCYADVLHKRKQRTISATRFKNYVNSTTHRRPQKVFAHLDDPLCDTHLVEDGVHLTWMGDREQFEQKLQGSIEGYEWSRDKDKDQMWASKKNNRLFSWKRKFKADMTGYLPLADNKEMTESMKQYIKNKPNWLLNTRNSS